MPERRPEVVRHGITEGLKLPVGGFKLHDAFAQFLVQTGDLFLAQLQVPEQEAGGIDHACNDNCLIDAGHGGEQEEMADHVRRPEHAHVLRERQLGKHGRHDRTAHQAQYRAVERFPVPDEQAEAGQKHEDDDVFAVYLEAGQPPAFDKAFREQLQEDRPYQKGRDQGVNRNHLWDVELPRDEKRGNEKGERGQIPEGDPELRRKIGVMRREDPEALVGEGVEQLQGAGEQKGDAKEKKVMVFLHLPRIPRKDEDHEGHDYAEQFDEGVEEQVAIEAGSV